MALTFTTKYEGRLDRKKLKIVEITHDGSATTATAANLGLNYIDYAMATAATVPLSATTAAFTDLTTNSGTGLAFTALSSGALVSILALGT